MSNRIYTSIGRYFHRLGLAFIGRDYTSYVNADLTARVEKAEADMKHLKECYCSALDKWEQAGAKLLELQRKYDAAVKEQQNSDSLIKKLFNEGAELSAEVANYKKLVETLRGTIRDKQAMIDAYQTAEKNNKDNE